MNSVDDTDAAIESFALGRCGYSHAVLFRAAKAFFEYRKNDNGERKTGALTDFLIGALAEVEAAPLITRAAGTVAAYFPTVEIIRPECCLMSHTRRFRSLSSTA